ncbi:MAG: metal-dependent hydrolase [Candidatus Pelagadaptatus aseana]|uniref:MBL fold metallo-hydrolase n=1 Tax=Candidatus Pelagadaptatus aseana TaxID=3120508 RepID=UPI0039B32628
MKLRYFGYNAFLIETGEYRIAIDPGALFFYWFRFSPLIPKHLWPGISHILVTHGDPDHYWHVDRVAGAAAAPVIFHNSMLRDVGGRQLALGPRSKGVVFNTALDRVHGLSVNQTVAVEGLQLTGLAAVHGDLQLQLGPFTHTVKTGPGERIGWGAMGFDIAVNHKRLVNLGDTLLLEPELLESEWQPYAGADVLMIPIGGRLAHNTMSEDEALQAVKVLQPEVVIPCHYNCPGLFSRRLNPADDLQFKRDVESLGIRCEILQPGEALRLD